MVKIDLGDLEDTQFGAYNARRSIDRGKFLGNALERELISFHIDSTSVLFIKQYEIERRKEVNEAFEIIEKSFGIETE